MNITKTALMDTLFYDERPAYENEECEIRIDDKEIVVSYQDDNGFVIYKGKEDGHGHYVLKCPEKHGEASLHMFPKGKVLDGYWKEDGYRGFWRIHLPDDIKEYMV